MTDEQIEECLLEAEREADAPESEWLLYGQKVAKKAQAEMQGRLAARDARIAELEQALERIVRTPPPVIDGAFAIEHYDIDGDPLGTESIDPMSVVSEMVGVAMRALDEKATKP